MFPAPIRFLLVLHSTNDLLCVHCVFDAVEDFVWRHVNFVLGERCEDGSVEKNACSKLILTDKQYNNLH